MPLDREVIRALRDLTAGAEPDRQFTLDAVTFRDLVEAAAAEPTEPVDAGLAPRLGAAVEAALLRDLIDRDDELAPMVVRLFDRVIAAIDEFDVGGELVAILDRMGIPVDPAELQAALALAKAPAALPLPAPAGLDAIVALEPGS